MASLYLTIVINFLLYRKHNTSQLQNDLLHGVWRSSLCLLWALSESWTPLGWSNI